MSSTHKYADRFWRHVKKTETCWIWTAYKNEKGYGKFTLGYAENKKSVRAHRFAYELIHGEIPKGKQLDHTCYNKACVNPDHLRITTTKQNQENRPGAQRNSSTGARGVYMHRNGTYYARVKHRQVIHNAGTYSTIEEAAEAAKQLRLLLFTHNDADRHIA